MKRFLLVYFCLLTTTVLLAQTDDHAVTEAKVYQATPEKVNDMVHTRLDARFDFSKSQLIGKAWLTLKPHFYATDSLRLDAKGMEIKQVSIVKNGKFQPLKYQYDGMQLDIDLDKKYKQTETYTVYIDYIAKPDEFQAKGSAAITDAKGLYFINPKGEEKGKPTQIWTQGETEATSVYIPVIDKPNQKTTQEFFLTVPGKYFTLSNGKLMSHKANTDGTFTDYWKMDLPHAPYLFFIGVGEFAIIKDSYKGKDVTYYVEKEYSGVARKIFGNTPEMMKFFSAITGVDYPWVKYGQMVGRDYVSGAMENTTATLHQESAYQDARELTDGNRWEDVIAHELFHQWFGDYVTTESWSNLTLNESFANYSEYLWREYKYGRDAADAHAYTDMQGYLMSGSEDKDLVRYYYHDKEDMFDAVSYNKGGRILHMLRNFVGDTAFFAALNHYLVTNKFKAAEAHQLRLSFEEITGKDLNWFWNQWYFSAGHPKLDITYDYNADRKQAIVVVNQTQTNGKIFQLPVTIDLWQGNKKNSYFVWADDKSDTFYLNADKRPELVNLDPDKVLLATRKENKSLAEYAFQYKVGTYLDRMEAIDAAGRKQDDPIAKEILLAALKDPYHGLRSHAISKLDIRKPEIKTATESLLVNIAKADNKRTVKAAAIAKLGDYKKAEYTSLFKTAVNDSSYTVAGNALEALSKIDSAAAYQEAKRLASQTAKGKLADAIMKSMIRFGDESAAELILGNFEKMPMSQEKFEALEPMLEFLTKVKNLENFKRGVNEIMKFTREIPEQYRDQVSQMITFMLGNLQKKKAAEGLKEQADYLDSQLKKGF